MTNDKFVVWFSEVDKEDIPLVGGKGANLGEMVKVGFPVPDGFIVTSQAYFHFLKVNNLEPKIRKILENLDTFDPLSLAHVSSQIKKLILHGKIPKEIFQPILKYYSRLGGIFKESLVAIRSSATAEDLPTASFAGQQVTFLNVKGDANVVEKVRECWASLFEPRAIFYRSEQKFDHFKVGIAVPVQKMVASQVSGVMFTVDPVTHDKKKIIIEAIWGLGEMIVQGQVTPDQYFVEKGTLKIIKRVVAKQEKMLVGRGDKNLELKVPGKMAGIQKLKDENIVVLADFGKKIEKHYYHPQDIEWALEEGKIYILQTRPVTTLALPQEENKKEEIALKKLPLLLKGDPASPGIAWGPVKSIASVKQIGRIISGEVLVASQTNPDFVPAMRKVVAIITDKGGRTSHAAIVSRELGIPCVVGTEKATEILKTGRVVTVNGGTGEIFSGSPPLAKNQRTIFHPDLGIKGLNLTAIKTATKVYVNLAEPEKAAEVAQKNVDGIGLLRAEFMMAQIGFHPKKLIHDRKQNLFVEKMCENLKIFCEQFQPRPVVYRASDLKTNEYRNLIGGKDYEPEEPNPLLGYRGCFRYIHDPEVFELELAAIRRVRNKFGFRNLWLMLPFVRTVKELQETKKIMAGQKLMRSPSFKLWLMVEIPSNVILLEKFIETGIDGISIGSNDLTMLVLGIDRDNSEVAPAFDERNEAVLALIEKAIKICHKYDITSSICGQAPSVYPQLTEKLVEWGITSISVSPDMIEQTREIVYRAENRLVTRGKRR